MRPDTVAEACRWVCEGQPFDRAMGDFLQGFSAEPSPARRSATLAEKPAPFDDPRCDPLLGGTAEELFKRWAPASASRWIRERSRDLTRSWVPHVGDDPGLREYLTFVGPGEFESRNVMVGDDPLRRANTPRR